MGDHKVTYYDPKQSGSFGGVQNVQRNVKEPVKKWLSSQDTYTLHKPIRHRFPRRKVVVSGIDSQWQADLVDVSALKGDNDGYKYLLTCIDVFSKFAWIEPIRNKTGQALVAAFENIVQDRKPVFLQTDKGTEFTNRRFQKWLRDAKIQFFTTHNEETKASIVERFNRTIKTRMWRYFTSKNTRRYIDVLSDLLFSYNHSLHRSIKTTPVSVSRENQEEIWLTLYGDTLQDPKPPRLPEGVFVRITKARRNFRKGYLPNWTEELFIVEKTHLGNPPYYTLKDMDGERLEGTFYEEEVQEVTKLDNVYKIESVIDKRTRGKVVQVLVKWLGYPAKFNSWISEKDILRHA